jgi:transposase-like protein
MEFLEEFPDDATCLDFLWRERLAPDGHHAECPKCERERKFHRVKSRPSYSCDTCGWHLHPLKGTVFEKSSTSLKLWFYAFYLMTSTRCGVSAKHLERELGVTYKTAWRMANKIRNVLMDESDDEPLGGIVEMDETSVDGRPRKHLDRSQAARYRERSRATVFAAVERGGRIKATVLPSRRGPAIHDQAIQWVRPESIVMTDEWGAYNRLGEYFLDHSRVIHSAREYARGDTNTNTIEGFFGNLKTGIRGNYKKVSHRWLQGYLNEFCWRYNHRHGVGDGSTFKKLLLRSAS